MWDGAKSVNTGSAIRNALTKTPRWGWTEGSWKPLMPYNYLKKGIRQGKTLGYLAWEMNRTGWSFTFWQAVLSLAQKTFWGVVRKAEAVRRVRKRLSSSLGEIKLLKCNMNVHILTYVLQGKSKETKLSINKVGQGEGWWGRKLLGLIHGVSWNCYKRRGNHWERLNMS